MKFLLSRHECEQVLTNELPQHATQTGSLSLPQYFFCLLLIFLIELVAGVLAYVYYQRVSDHCLIKSRLLLNYLVVVWGGER